MPHAHNGPSKDKIRLDKRVWTLILFNLKLITYYLPMTTKIVWYHIMRGQWNTVDCPNIILHFYGEFWQVCQNNLSGQEHFFLINDAEYSHESEKLDSILKSYIDINLKNTDLNKLKLEKHIE